MRNEITSLLPYAYVTVRRTHRDTRWTLSRYAEATSPPLIELRTIGYLDGGRGNGHLLMVNLAAINDCFYRHSYTHRYIAVIDFDEVKSPAFARTKLSPRCRS